MKQFLTTTKTLPKPIYIDKYRVYKAYRNILNRNRTTYELIFEEQLKLLKVKYIVNKGFLRKAKTFCIVDFYIPEYNIAIEIDGKYHNNRRDYDRHRDLYLNSRGIMVLRFSNQEINTQITKVMNTVLVYLNKKEAKVLSEELLNYQNYKSFK